ATGARAAKKAVASRAVIEKKVAQSKTTRVLALRECGLKALPLGATAADAALLRTADFSANLLRALPAEIGLWTGLQTLLCSENELTELPASIGQLACLQKLILSKNKLRTLPIEFSSLSKAAGGTHCSRQHSGLLAIVPDGNKFTVSPVMCSWIRGQ
ncbi:unnamed protein product, partial [Polarella glacialis]